MFRFEMHGFDSGRKTLTNVFRRSIYCYKSFVEFWMQKSLHTFLQERTIVGIAYKGGDDMTFSDLKQKDVINVCDGRRLGKPMDIVLNEAACAEALVVPANSGFLNMLKQEKEGCLIPWRRILRIGDDVILVDIGEENYTNREGNSV